MGFVWAQVLVRNLLFILVFLPTLVLSLTIPSPVIDSDWLSQNLDAVIVLDVRQDSQDLTKKSILRMLFWWNLRKFKLVVLLIT